MVPDVIATEIFKYIVGSLIALLIWLAREHHKGQTELRERVIRLEQNKAVMDVMYANIVTNMEQINKKIDIMIDNINKLERRRYTDKNNDSKD